MTIAENILSTGDPSAYLKFLTTGGSDYPIPELRIAGVDFEKPEVVARALQEFAEAVDKLSEILK